MIRNHIWLLNNALKMRILNPVGDDNKQTEKKQRPIFSFFQYLLIQICQFFFEFYQFNQK